MDVLDEGFFSQAFRDRYWRQKPCVVRAAQPRPDLDSARFQAAAERARQEDPVRVKEGAGTVFIEAIERYLRPMETLLAPFRTLAPGSPVWCDAIRTEGHGGGIGCHFDDSDNFVFQLEGAKHWRLHAPDIIPADRVRRRLLQEQGVGGIHMPEDSCLEVRIEPGDALYLPILWPHWGESEGPSLSLSVAVNPTSLVRLIRWELERVEHDPVFFMPLKAGHDLTGEVSRLFLDLRGKANVEAAPTAPVVTIPREGSVEPAELIWDVARLRRLLAGLCQVPDPAAALLGGDRPENLQAPFAGLMLKRLCLGVKHAHERDINPATRFHLALCARVLGQAPDLALRTWACSPDTTAWVWQMARTLSFHFAPQIETVAAYLGNQVLDLAIQARLSGPARGLFLTLAGSTLELPGAGLRLRFPIPGLEQAQVDLEGERMKFRAAMALGWLETGPEGPRAGGGLEWEPLPRVPGTTIVLCHGSPMVHAFYPRRKEERASRILEVFQAKDVERYQAALGEGMAFLDRVWPEGAADVRAFVSVAVPLEDDQGPDPNNQSVHAFRGLVATSPRGGASSAQTWMHESGHNKFSTLMDLSLLVDEGNASTTIFSPFVGTERPWQALLHGLFSFARDLEATRRLMGVVPEPTGMPLDSYFNCHLQRWRQALGLAEAGLRFTPQGAKLMGAFRTFDRSLPAHQVVH